MKGLSSKRIALKADVIGPENILFENILFENILFAGASLHLSACKCYRLGQRRG